MWPTNDTLLDNHEDGYVHKIRLDRGSSSWCVLIGVTLSVHVCGVQPYLLPHSIKSTTTDPVLQT